MITMELRIAHGLMKDGTTWEGVPVTTQTSVQAEKTTVANRWSTDVGLTVDAFISWHAAKVAGYPVGDTWDAALPNIVHAEFRVIDVDPTKALEGLRASTPSAPGTGSPFKRAESPE